MGSRVVEAATGAQILPPPREQDTKQHFDAWPVFCCISAELRTRSPEHAALAAKVRVERVER